MPPLNSDKNFKFLRLAKHIAEKTTELSRQFGALIVLKNRIVAAGRNRKSHPGIPRIISQVTEKRYYGLHAEISAMLHCDFSIKGSIVYVYGQNLGTNHVLYSKPCELCEYELRNRGVAQAIFITATGYEMVDYTQSSHHNKISKYYESPIPGGNCRGE